MTSATISAKAHSPASANSELQGMVIFAKDIERVAAFYANVLQLQLREDANSHKVLANESLELVVHAIPKAIARNIAIESPPQARAQTPLKPMFKVNSLTELQPLIEANEGTLKPLQSAWSIRGDRVLDGCDPEGNVLQFRESE